MALTKAAPAEEAAPAKGGGGKKKIIAIVAVLALAAGAYFMFFKKSEPEVAPPPEPGAVLPIEPITLNLADGHFLKLGLALQLTSHAGGGGHGGSKPDGSKALDIAIDHLSNRRVAELSSNEARSKAKEKLKHAIEEAYHHEVMDVYFTEFVMQ